MHRATSAQCTGISRPSRSPLRFDGLGSGPGLVIPGHAASPSGPTGAESLHLAHVEMLSGRRKKDYEAEQAADSLVAQAEALGEAPATEPIAEPYVRTGRVQKVIGL
jgi:hypothetical protein